MISVQRGIIRFFSKEDTKKDDCNLLNYLDEVKIMFK